MSPGQILLSSLQQTLATVGKVGAVVGLVTGAFAAGRYSSQAELRQQESEVNFLRRLQNHTQPPQQQQQISSTSSANGATNYFINVFGNSTAVIHFDSTTNTLRIEGNANNVNSIQQMQQQPPQN